MKKWVCQVCGYVYEGAEPPAKCPQCGAPASKFKEQAGEMTWACEHVVGIAKDAPEDIKKDLLANFNGECCEVGMYLAMSRQAIREGYPEVGMYYHQAALEEAEHASKFAELLGEVVTDSTKKNLEMRVEAENGATAGSLIWLSALRLKTWTLSMTPYTRWLRTKPAMAELSPLY